MHCANPAHIKLVCPFNSGKLEYPFNSGKLDLETKLWLNKSWKHKLKAPDLVSPILLDFKGEKEHL